MQVITSMLKDMRSRQLHRHHHRSSVVAAIEDCAFTNQNCSWSNMPEELLREVLLRSINTDEMLSAAGGGRRRRGRKVVAAIEDCAFTNQNCSWSNMPELEWDFRLPLVKSINVSGHKYGLVYAGVGWVIWRNKDDLPDELIFHINYLGVDQPTFTLNFSKGSSQIIAQYYQLIRLGFEGYRNIMENCADNAQVLKEGLEKIGRFDIVSKDIGVPLVAFSLKDSSRHTEFEVSDMLRRFGWIVPAYTMPADAQHITVLRVVIREDFSRTLAERLINDIEKVLHELDEMPERIDRTKITAVTETTGSSDGGETYVVVKKSEIETQREITNAWKKFVAEKKVKKSGVC